MQQHRFHPLMKMLRTVVPLGAAVLLAGCGGPAGFGTGKQTTIEPLTQNAEVVQHIYALVTWIDIAIFIVVAGLLAFAVIRYRARPGQENELPKQVHGNVLMELTWTIIPAIILIFIAVPTWSGIFHAAHPPTEGAYTVEAIGHQWFWEFRYPDHGVVTANELVLPANKPVVIKTRSVDVIHSFWVPRLSGKIDSFPDHVNQIWFKPVKIGLYYGQCAEFCGTSHANMRFRVHVVSEGDFNTWLQHEKEPPQPTSEDAKAGQQLFVTKTCIACHSISGNPMAVGVAGPNLTNLSYRTTIGAGILENTQANIVQWIRHTQSIKPGAKMGVPQEDGSYRPIDMTDQEAAQIAAYLDSPPGPAAGAAPAGQAAAMTTGGAAAPAGGETAVSLFQSKGCIGCHTIPGVPGAVGKIGPNLEHLMSRPTIAAGKLKNTPENLHKWISNPKAIKPDTLMAPLPMTPQELDTVVAYLETLK
ncbi:MAG TPA: cytochrome c oxidase subunit II [bacterium]|nr:cytochrome c oxidase subunit II [bacterium]